MSGLTEPDDGLVSATIPETFTLEISREFRASCETLYRCFTEPRAIAEWFGPKGVSCRECDVELDARVGGQYRFVMATEAGAPVILVGRFLELERPRRIRMTLRWEHIAAGPDSKETLLTVEFDSIEGGARLRIVHELFSTEPSRANHAAGWESSLECLAEALVR